MNNVSGLLWLVLGGMYILGHWEPTPATIAGLVCLVGADVMFKRS